MTSFYRLMLGLLVWGFSAPAPSPAAVIEVQPPPQVSNYELLLRKSSKTNAVGDPVWTLTLVTGTGQAVASMPAVTGRAYTQTLDRNTPNNESPLPTGNYSILRNGIERGPFPNPELGRGYWVPMQPQFATGRSNLGFHVDPSFGLHNGQSGTAGCVGLLNTAATEQLVAWINTHNVKTLRVIS